MLQPVRIKRHILLSLLIGVAIMLIGFIGWIFMARAASQRASVTHLAPSSYLEKVSEEPVPSNYKWHGPPDEPKYISLPTINTSGFVQSVGIAKNKEIQVPPNIHTVGWFNQSSKPGQPGVSVIDGHVDGTTKPGIFRHLGELKPGDQFTVQLGNDTTKTFRVLSVTYADLATALSVLFSQTSGVSSQLNLITCGGTFDKQSKTYDKRIIVSSALYTPAG